MKKICEVRYFGAEPVPWTVPTVGVNRTRPKHQAFTTRARKTRQDQQTLSLEDWQQRVHDAAVAAFKSGDMFRPMTTGALYLKFTFYAQTPPGFRHGELWDAIVLWKVDKKTGVGRWAKKEHRNCHEPDGTNLVKAAEDALEGAIFPNDLKVRASSHICLYGPQAGVLVQVYEIEPSDYPGTGDPVLTLAEQASAQAGSTGQSVKNPRT